MCVPMSAWCGDLLSTTRVLMCFLFLCSRVYVQHLVGPLDEGEYVAELLVLSPQTADQNAANAVHEVKNHLSSFTSSLSLFLLVLLFCLSFTLFVCWRFFFPCLGTSYLFCVWVAMSRHLMFFSILPSSQLDSHCTSSYCTQTAEEREEEENNETGFLSLCPPAQAYIHQRMIMNVSNSLLLRMTSIPSTILTIVLCLYGGHQSFPFLSFFSSCMSVGNHRL